MSWNMAIKPNQQGCSSGGVGALPPGLRILSRYPWESLAIAAAEGGLVGISSVCWKMSPPGPLGFNLMRGKVGIHLIVDSPVKHSGKEFGEDPSVAESKLKVRHPWSIRLEWNLSDPFRS